MQASRLAQTLVTLMLLTALCIFGPVRVRGEAVLFQVDREGMCVERVLPDDEASLPSAGWMTPGDSAQSEFLIKNTQDRPFTLTVEAEDSVAGTGSSLLDGLWVEVSEDGAVLADFPARGGRYTFPAPFLPGTERRVAFKVWLPHEAGNEYQQMTLSLGWVLTAQAGPLSPLPGSGNAGGASTGIWIPLTQGAEPVVLTEIREAAAPLGSAPQMPKTGEPPLWPVLAAGLLLIGGGLVLLAGTGTGADTSSRKTANSLGDKPAVVSDKLRE